MLRFLIGAACLTIIGIGVLAAYKIVYLPIKAERDSKVENLKGKLRFGGILAEGAAKDLREMGESVGYISLYQTSYEDTDLSGYVVSFSASYSVVKGVDFSNTEMTLLSINNSHVSDTKFDGAVLTLVNISDSTFDNVSFVGACSNATTEDLMPKGLPEGIEIPPCDEE